MFKICIEVPPIHIDVHLHSDQPAGIGELQAAMVQLAKSFSTFKGAVMAALDDLRAAVAKNTDVDQSAVILLQGLKAKLDAAIASGDPAAIQALADALGADNQKLADAVTLNTPAEPDPVP